MVGFSIVWDSRIDVRNMRDNVIVFIAHTICLDKRCFKVRNVSFKENVLKIRGLSEYSPNLV